MILKTFADFKKLKKGSRVKIDFKKKESPPVEGTLEDNDYDYKIVTLNTGVAYYENIKTITVKNE